MVWIRCWSLFSQRKTTFLSPKEKTSVHSLAFWLIRQLIDSNMSVYWTTNSGEKTKQENQMKDIIMFRAGQSRIFYQDLFLAKFPDMQSLLYQIELQYYLIVSADLSMNSSFTKKSFHTSAYCQFILLCPTVVWKLFMWQRRTTDCGRCCLADDTALSLHDLLIYQGVSAATSRGFCPNEGVERRKHPRGLTFDFKRQNLCLNVWTENLRT